MVTIAMIWLACGLASYPQTFAYFQGEFPSIAERDYRKDLSYALGMGALFGPVALILGIFLSEFWKHGLKFK